jgi:hypothetical protein
MNIYQIKLKSILLNLFYFNRIIELGVTLSVVLNLRNT